MAVGVALTGNWLPAVTGRTRPRFILLGIFSAGSIWGHSQIMEIGLKETSGGHEGPPFVFAVPDSVPRLTRAPTTQDQDRHSHQNRSFLRHTGHLQVLPAPAVMDHIRRVVALQSEL